MATALGNATINVTLDTAEAKKKAEKLKELKEKYYTAGEVPILKKTAFAEARKDFTYDLAAGGGGIEAYIRSVASQVQTAAMKDWFKGKLGAKWGGSKETGEAGLLKEMSDEVRFYAKLIENVLPPRVDGVFDLAPDKMEKFLKNALGIDIKAFSKKISGYITATTKAVEVPAPTARSTVEQMTARMRLGNQLTAGDPTDVFAEIWSFRHPEQMMKRESEKGRQAEWARMMKRAMIPGKNGRW